MERKEIVFEDLAVSWVLFLITIYKPMDKNKVVRKGTTLQISFFLIHS